MRSRVIKSGVSLLDWTLLQTSACYLISLNSFSSSENEDERLISRCSFFSELNEEKYIYKYLTRNRELVLNSNQHILGFPGGSDDKEPACDAGDPGSIGKIPVEGNGFLLQYSYLENSVFWEFTIKQVQIEIQLKIDWDFYIFVIPPYPATFHNVWEHYWRQNLQGAGNSATGT